MSEEKWKVIPDFADYAVSDHGNVKRVRDAKTSKSGRLLRLFTHKSGYVGVILRRDGRSVTHYAHSLVLTAFVCPRPTKSHQAAHVNGVRNDNRIGNLRWATPLENCADKKIHGTDQVGMKHHMRKITDADVLEIRRLRQQGVYCKDIARKFGLHKAYVSLVANGRRWGHVA